MLVKKAFKFRIYPNKEQQRKLAIQFGHARFVYNRYRAWREQSYKETDKGLSYHQTAVALTELKKAPEFDWLKEADSQVLQQKLKDLDTAYQNFFAGQAKYPNFKSKRGKQTIRYPQRFKVDGKKIYLPKVGWVKFKQHRPLEGEMKNCTVMKTKSGKYFVSIQSELEIDEPALTGSEVGLDLGLNHFATLSTGQKIENPKYLRKAEKKLIKLQRRLARKKKGSNGWEKARLKVARQHEKISNQRADFLHKASRKLVNECSLIKIENLNVAGMLKNHHLAKAIADVGWHKFKQMLEYKGGWYGCVIEQVDRFFASSKICHHCHHKNGDLELKDRIWICPQCGTEHDRDENAAINILNFNTVGTTEINAGEELVIRHSLKPEASQL